MSIGMSMSCLNTRFSMVKQHFVIRNEMALIKSRLANYLLPQHFEVD